ncbi:hut operon transcriptional regulator HutP [Sediminibacillus terrae]|uniref:hut operon transcriptional regulator HutP n=1 Tax=Sediminibacillus terrae TaxID=1562106 RepID=UPI001296A19A|nr:hut operon transcriptional regulator HutP [Sediminibacillus terrae]
MLLQVDRRIGKQAMLLVLNEQFENDPEFNKQIERQKWQFCTGKVGSMDSHKVVAAIETAAKRNGIIKADLYRELHALYHAIIEALHGVTRGQVQLGTILRTVGLRFALVRGNPYDNEEEGEWLAIALYGTIGAPVKGLEHETIGLGINHI